MKTPTETFLIISPSPSVSTYASFLKRGVRKVLGHTFESEFSKAHISLLKYRDPHIDNVLYHINSRLSTLKPFPIYIKDFDILYHGSNRTICLNVINKNSVRELAEKLTRREIRPHITIAKNLPVNAFNKVWPLIKNISYSDHFWCDHVTVLQRDSGSWRYYMDLHFS